MPEDGHSFVFGIRPERFPAGKIKIRDGDGFPHLRLPLQQFDAVASRSKKPGNILRLMLTDPASIKIIPA